MKLIVALGLIVALPVFAQQDPDANTSAAKKAQEQRERAIARCKENRGADCESEAGSRSIHQTAPRPTPRPGN